MLAIAAQLVLLLYHQLTTAVDFYPFNGVRFTKAKERLVEQAINGVLMVAPVIGFAFHFESLIYYGVAYYFILFAVECATWWVPYFFGASDKWAEIYLRVHAGTLGVLPGRNRRPAPNLEHLILMALTITTAVVTWLQFRESHPAGYARSWIPIAVGILCFCGTSIQMVRNEKPRRTA